MLDRATRLCRTSPQMATDSPATRPFLRRMVSASRSACVARSNILLLNALGAEVRVVGPSTLMPAGIEDMGVSVHRNMAEGLRDVDVVMMLRLQRERMEGAFVPSVREYFRHFGLDAEKLSLARPDALVMHPGPMNRGVEIASGIADGPQSVIEEQVEMGVAVRMAVMEWLAGNDGDNA